MLFFLQDGSFLPMDMALNKAPFDLIGGDDTALSQPSTHVTLRIEVNRPIMSSSELLLIGCLVAGVPAQGLPSGLADTMQQGGS